MRMILADDEVVIINGLQKLLDWSSLGVELVGAYEDGKAAFDGIVSLHPDVALLDISMPGKTGIEILKECRLMQLKTQIIFISGFHDFAYAKEAVKWGAVDYLLKPVIRDELLSALEKCSHALGRQSLPGREGTPSLEENEYERLIQGEGFYQPVLVQAIYPESSEGRTQKLMDFSVVSSLDRYLTEHDRGFAAFKQGHISAVLKLRQSSDSYPLLAELKRTAEQAVGAPLYVLPGQIVSQMSDVAEAYQQCLLQQERLFFADRYPGGILSPLQPQTGEKSQSSGYRQAKDALLRAVLRRDEAAFNEVFPSLEQAIYDLSGEKKEDTCFYFCTVIRQAEIQLEQLDLSEPAFDMTDLLEIGRATRSYTELVNAYRDTLRAYMQGLQRTAERSERAIFLKAKDYIEEHYTQELTLAVLAEYVHMNPYYFSAFFKKYAGINFKAYVNHVRLQHAVTLLVSTNKKILDIALEVGFADTRAFSSSFQKTYHETPNAYRSRLRAE